ncbi:MAG: GlsB/YeaQ/YmgE family stress response membrane protein [Firmicutes bacterium]|nr:GlsB/YeaQ/YmgE family stress response membrane protein [Bacillota bacterium]
MLWGLLCWVLVGLAAGYVAGKIMGTGTESIGKNIVIGLVGSIVGGLIAWVLGLGARSIIGSILIAIVGACVAIWAYRKFIKK